MKKFFILSAALLLVSASSYFLFSSGNNIQKPSVLNHETKDNTDKNYTDVMAETETVNTYVIKKYGEKIGVFRKGAGKPFRVIDTFVFTLPKTDIVMLSRGFTVYETELSGIVEDYTG